MWELYNSQQKNRDTSGETTIDAVSENEKVKIEGAIPQRESQRGDILKWLKKPAQKLWRSIRGIFRHKR